MGPRGPPWCLRQMRGCERELGEVASEQKQDVAEAEPCVCSPGGARAVWGWEGVVRRATLAAEAAGRVRGRWARCE